MKALYNQLCHPDEKILRLFILQRLELSQQCQEMNVTYYLCHFLLSCDPLMGIDVGEREEVKLE